MTSNVSSLMQELDLDVLSYLKMKSIKCVFITTILAFLIAFIFIIFYSNFVIVNNLYADINKYYLGQYVIEPIRNENDNFTQTIIIRIKTVDEMLTESKLINIKIATDFVFNNDIDFQMNKYQIDNNYKPSNNLSQLPNYYLNMSSNKDNNFIYNKLFQISFYLKFFQSNFNRPIVPTEIVVYDLQSDNYIQYCYNCDRAKLYLIPRIKEYSKRFLNNSIVNSGSPFLDYIVKNIYSERDYNNYLKFMAYNITGTTAGDFKLITGLRFENDQILKIYNKNSTNMTIIYSEESSSNYHFIPCSNFMDNFFSYAINPIQLHILANISFAQTYERVMNERQYMLKSFNYYLNQINSTLYNPNLENELKIISGLLLTAIKHFDGVDVLAGNQFLLNSESDSCNKSPLHYSQLLCNVRSFVDNTKIVPLRMTFGDLVDLNRIDKLDYTTNSTDPITISILKTLEKRFYGATYYLDTVFFNQVVNQTTNTFIKKFLIYKDITNNLPVIILQMLDVEDYSTIQETFDNDMKDMSNLLFYLMFACSVIVFGISISITVNKVKKLLLRINCLNDIKNDIFYKTEHFDLSKFSIEHSDSNGLINRILSGNVTDNDKYELIQKDKFYEQVLILIIQTKMKLIKVLYNTHKGNIKELF